MVKIKTEKKLLEEVWDIILDSLVKPYNLSPVEKANRIYTDVEIRFRKIRKIRETVLVEEQKKILDKYCYCKRGEGTFMGSTKTDEGVCCFCFIKKVLFGDEK